MLDSLLRLECRQQFAAGKLCPTRTKLFYCAKASKRERNEGLEGLEKKAPNRYGKMNGTDDHGAKHDTPEANHYTSVKPLKLCRYLCRLVTPTGGVVLDPFCGSGSVGVAALGEGFGFVGVEQSAEYKAIAEARLQFSR